MAQSVTRHRREKSILFEEDEDTDPEDCEDCQKMSGIRCFRHFEE